MRRYNASYCGDKCVSVGLIVFDISSKLEASIDSVLQQSECLELYVLYSAAIDDSVIARCSSKYFGINIRFLRDTIGNLYEFTNEISVSFKGTFFAFLSCGDVWSPSALSASLCQLNKSSNFLMTYGLAEVIDIQSGTRRPFRSLRESDDISGFCDGLSIALSTVVMKRSAWLLLQGFDQSASSFFELDFVIRAYKMFRSRIGFVSRFQADIHCVLDENIETDRMFRLMIEKFQFLNNHGLPALNFLKQSLMNILSNMKSFEELSVARKCALLISNSFYSDLSAEAMELVSKCLILKESEFEAVLQLEARCFVVYKSDGLAASLISCVFPGLHTGYFARSKGPYAYYCDSREKYINSIDDLKRIKEFSLLTSGEKVSKRFKQRPFGVNLIGHAFDVFGLGESLRMMARAFIDAGVPLCIVDVPARNGCNREQNFLENYICGRSDDCAPYAFNVICMSPASHAKWLLEGGFVLTVGRFSIGAWFWETSRWPAPWTVLLRFVDSVWPASELIKSALEQDCTRNDVVLNRMPFPAEIRKRENFFVEHRRNDVRIRYGIPVDKIVFVFGFDVNSRLERKNPMACIRVFNETFGDPSSDQCRDDVCLVIKTFKPERESREWSNLVEIASRDIRIFLISESLEREDLLWLYASCDVFLSLHRSEGYGLGMAEALQLGLRVVATGYGGNVDFCLSPSAYLVDSKLVPIARGAYPFADDHYWAEPDLKHAKKLCLQVVSDLGSVSSFKSSDLGFQSFFSISRTGSLYRQFLDNIYSLGF